VIADIECNVAGDTTALRFRPITLSSDAPGADSLHGNPRFAEGAGGTAILSRLRELSRPFGTDLNIDGASASVRLPS
jgi:hypothetical protein